WPFLILHKILLYLLKTMSMKEKVFIKNKIMEYGERIPKPLILYSDATITDTLGKSQLHLIYLSIGNIPTWRRNKPDAKQLLGYLPILEAVSSHISRSAK